LQETWTLRVYLSKLSFKLLTLRRKLLAGKKYLKRSRNG
jgi:hypothetical protein